jgi:hypothetical protein
MNENEKRAAMLGTGLLILTMLTGCGGSAKASPTPEGVRSGATEPATAQATEIPLDLANGESQIVSDDGTVFKAVQPPSAAYDNCFSISGVAQNVPGERHTSYRLERTITSNFGEDTVVLFRAGEKPLPETDPNFLDASRNVSPTDFMCQIK